MSEQRFAWQVPVDHPAFAGHFPGHPILPGVVLLDRAILPGPGACADGHADGAGWTVSQAKFLSPVGPGEELSFVSDAGRARRLALCRARRRRACCGLGQPGGAAGMTEDGQADWMQQEERSHALVLRFMVWLSLTFGRRLGRVVLHAITAYFVLVCTHGAPREPPLPGAGAGAATRAGAMATAMC